MIISNLLKTISNNYKVAVFSRNGDLKIKRPVHCLKPTNQCSNFLGQTLLV